MHGSAISERGLQLAHSNGSYSGSDPGALFLKITPNSIHLGSAAFSQPGGLGSRVHKAMSGQSLDRQTLLARLEHGLIVSCQAEVHEALHGAQNMAAMARAACQGGAAGIRADGPEDIVAIRAVVDLPLIGIYKEDLAGFAVRITPTLQHARQVAKAGADLIAVDATNRPHPDGLEVAERIQSIHRETGRLVVADISTQEEGLAAEAAGADLIATTLSGYTEATPGRADPDFRLIRQLAAKVSIPLLAEGRIATPEQAAEALRCGAFAVVVGSAITRPQWITARFVEGIRDS